MITDAIELTTFFAVGGASGFSAWSFRRHLQMKRAINGDPDLHRIAARRITVGLFHLLKPAVLLIVYAWCLFLGQGDLQAAIKNVGVTVVALLLLARSVYEHWDDVRPWDGLERRRVNGQQ